MSVKSPEEFFGHQMGADRKLVRWENIVKYFWQLDELPTVNVRELGKTTEGHPFLLAAISSPRNIANLEKIREQSWALGKTLFLPHFLFYILNYQEEAQCYPRIRSRKT